MASLNLFFTPIVTTHRRVRTAATAAKSAGSSRSSAEEKGFFDFILGGLAKQDQFYETDPILKKVENKSEGTTSRINSVVVPPPKKKDGGFDLGGLFAKK